jgi:hypothetical protein
MVYRTGKSAAARAYFIRIDRQKGVLKGMNARYVLLITAVVLYTILLAALLALSSPNFGALSRYKVAFVPFFVYLLLWAAQPAKHTQR